MSVDPAVQVVAVEDAFWADGSDLAACLKERRIPAYYGYDAAGSALFEEITELPTYYLTRVEQRLLRRHAAQIAELAGCDVVAELGSGSAKKTRLLLAACLDRRPTVFRPVDVSREMLLASARQLAADLPGLRVEGLWGRYEAGLAWLAAADRRPLLLAFLGSNLGNMTAAERDALLAAIAGTLRPGDTFLVTADLDKPGEVLEACYNDPPGHSAFARFRLNHLVHLNRLFGADFVPDRYRPRAVYDPGTATVEAHLYASEEQAVTLPGLDVALRLGPGDSLNVGYSCKFRSERLAEEVADHGLAPAGQWVDPVWQYGVFLFAR